MCRQDSSDPNDVILDLESPAKASRRSKSLRDTPTGVMQDTNAFKDDDHAPPSSPKTKTPQFPMRAQVRPCFLLSFQLARLWACM